MPPNKELKIEFYRLIELLRDSKKELVAATAELGKLTDEKAVLSDGLKKELSLVNRERKSYWGKKGNWYSWVR